jgi:hypothetical protein
MLAEGPVCSNDFTIITRTPGNSKELAIPTREWIGPKQGRSYARLMYRLFPMFPAGRAGAGLVLVRVSTIVAQLVGTYGQSTPTVHGRLAVVSWVLALSLGVGVATVPCALVCFVADIGLFVATCGPQARCVALAALLTVSIAVLGPGAYSADARLFGRRVMMFRDKSDPRGR